MSNKTKGVALAALASASYGLNPLFALPLYSDGLNADSVLLFRYGLAMVFIGIIMRLKGISFQLQKNEILPLGVMGLLFSFSSLALFSSYAYMDAGIASTILFTYPIMVALLMGAFFKERISIISWGALIIAFLGITLLGKTYNGQTLSVIGVILVLISSLTYAIYMIGINRSVLKLMPAYKLNFYVLLVGFSVFAFRIIFSTSFHVPTTPFYGLCTLGIALIPTIISLVTLTKAIHYIGSTDTAILGALEPMTAIFFGVLIFHEQLTFRIVVGIILILGSVTMIVLEKSLMDRIKLSYRRRHGIG
ncbi:MAG: DMT family transporter [Phocaeicola sp.]|uniref:DMT family transporter n=1 Tax=Phocaeicola sp. TaxID=2773926 RepID=UPI003F9EEDCB